MLPTFTALGLSTILSHSLFDTTHNKHTLQKNTAISLTACTDNISPTFETDHSSYAYTTVRFINVIKIQEFLTVNLNAAT